MSMTLRVSDAMTTELHCIRPDREIMGAAHRLVTLNISGLLVVDARDVLVGILTERDCIGVVLQAGYFDETAGRVADYMSTELQTIDASSSLMDVAERFAHGSHRRYPVLDADRLVGVIARRDILRALTSGAWFAAPAENRSMPK
ncbi:MAG: CBS domain-containing protein [Woeseia sp.]|nr:CBS domain-containing protein [Woeseia sp.]MBT8098063.1 CBS domain-containing protein [Woeseia sp.]NNE60614.1 CBS domain-containing protein [Woeseia sp.]NNL53635.1 CBS domain-containing protein [Woeseia sp.]